MNKRIKNILKLIMLLIVSNSFSQTEKIDNIQTEKHYQIPGTKYAIISPDENFINSSEYSGLQNKELETGINFTEIPMPYNKVLEMFTKDLPPQNGELLVNKDFLMNGFNSKLFKSNTTNSAILNGFENISDSEKTITWILLYGNSDFSLVLTSSYKYSLDEMLKSKIEQSLLSFLYLENEKVNPIEQLNYTLDTSTANLKFATIFMQTDVAYTIDGKFPTEAEKKSGYIIMILPFGVEENEREKRAIKNVKKPDDNIKIKETKEITIDDLNGYEIVGYEKKSKNENVLKYGTTLFDENKQYIIIGTSNHNLENNLIEFQKITRSFKRKK